MLLLHKADVNQKDSQGVTSLHNAAKYGYRNVSVALVKAKADILLRTNAGVFVNNAKDTEGYTAQDLAIKLGHIDVVSLFENLATFQQNGRVSCT